MSETGSEAGDQQPSKPRAGRSDFKEQPSGAEATLSNKAALLAFARTGYLDMTKVIPIVAEHLFPNAWIGHPAAEYYPFVLLPKRKPNKIVEFKVHSVTAELERLTLAIRDVQDEFGGRGEALKALKAFQSMQRKAALVVIGALEREALKGRVGSRYGGYENCISEAHIGAMRADILVLCTSGRFRFDPRRALKPIAAKVWIERASLDLFLCGSSEEGSRSEDVSRKRGNRHLAPKEEEYLLGELYRLESIRSQESERSGFQVTFHRRELIAEYCKPLLERRWPNSTNRRANSRDGGFISDRKIGKFLRKVADAGNVESDSSEDSRYLRLQPMFSSLKTPRRNRQKAASEIIATALAKQAENP